MGPLLLGVLLVAYSAESGREGRFDYPEAEPIGWVAGDEVSLKRFNELLEARLKFLRLLDDSVPDSVVLHLKAGLAAQLIDEKCLERAAKEDGVEASDGDVDEAFSALEQRWGDPDAFEQFRKDYPGGEEELRYRLRLQVLRERLLEKSVKPLGDEYLEEFFKQNPGRFDVPEHLYAQELLRRVRPDDSPEQIDAQRARAKELAERAREEDVSFDALAMRDSEGPTASVGGELGRVTPESIDKRLWQALEQLNPGDVSEVVETEAGFHVLKLRERRPAYRPGFEEVREALHAELQEAFQRARRAGLTAELRGRFEAHDELARRYAGELAVIAKPVGPTDRLEWSLNPDAKLPDTVFTGPGGGIIRPLPSPLHP